MTFAMRLRTSRRRRTKSPCTVTVYDATKNIGESALFRGLRLQTSINNVDKTVVVFFIVVRLS